VFFFALGLVASAFAFDYSSWRALDLKAKAGVNDAIYAEIVKYVEANKPANASVASHNAKLLNYKYLLPNAKFDVAAMYADGIKYIESFGFKADTASKRTMPIYFNINDPAKLKAIYEFMLATPELQDSPHLGWYCLQVTGDKAKAYGFYKQAKASLDRRLILAIQLKDSAKVDECMEELLVTPPRLTLAKIMITRYIDNVVGNPTYKQENVKAYLQGMNRKFSPMLIKDKANWEPLIAQIRTALETY
jgi:hypothetical protein